MVSNIAKIKTYDIANGKGIRTSIFFSGCTFACPGCFNSDIWDFNVGQPFNRELYEKEIKPTINEHIAGISILGGDGFHPRNIVGTCNLCRWFKKDFPDKTIWAWSGFTYEELISEEYESSLNLYDYIDDIPYLTLSLIDVLIDGRFIEKQKDLTLPYMGSKNQRVIDVQKSLKQDKVILYDQ